MYCFFCYDRLIVTSVWFSDKNNYQYSYICYCNNSTCLKYLEKFKKNCKTPAEIYECRHFQLTHQ